MAHTVKTPGSPSTFDERFAKEESRVRARSSGSPPDSRAERTLVLPPPPEGKVRPGETMAERNARIDSLVQRANAALAALPANDARGRLLASAVFRRDAVLLGALLDASDRFEPVAAPLTRRPR